jgi:hypothetical protein
LISNFYGILWVAAVDPTYLLHPERSGQKINRTFVLGNGHNAVNFTYGMRMLAEKKAQSPALFSSSQPADPGRRRRTLDEINT